MLDRIDLIAGAAWLLLQLTSLVLHTAIHCDTCRRSPGLGPASTRPINLYSRLDRLTPKPESADDDGSIHGISSEETVGEQQLDMSELYPSLLQPSAEGLEEVPDISIIRTLGELPADESAHLPNKGKRASSSSGVAPSESAGFKFHMGYLKEGTMTVEVSLACRYLYQLLTASCEVRRAAST